MGPERIVFFAAFFPTLILAILNVLGQLICRDRKTLTNLHFWLTILATVFTIPMLVTVCMFPGILDLSIHLDIYQRRKVIWLTGIFSNISLLCSKLSIVGLCHEIFGVDKLNKWAAYLSGIWIIVSSSALFIWSLFFCGPLQTISGPQFPSGCSNIRLFALLNAVFHTINTIILIALVVWSTIELKMSWSSKKHVIITFAAFSGVLAIPFLVLWVRWSWFRFPLDLSPRTILATYAEVLMCVSCACIFGGKHLWKKAVCKLKGLLGLGKKDKGEDGGSAGFSSTENLVP